MEYRPREQQGAALIIVVALLALMSAFVIAFYSRVNTDLASSRNYADSVNARQLADAAVGVVMGQIREATTVKGGAWGSQPGMIRVYGTGDAPGAQAHAFYKLYSSHDLIVSGRELSGFDPTNYDQAAAEGSLEVPLGEGGWRQQSAYFTDLNEPFETSPTRTEKAKGMSVAKRYPIFDPTVAALHDPNVYDPKRFERPWKIEGSSIALPEHLRESKGNEAPMPVRWIYVLRDGTLTAPAPLEGPATGTQGSIARWRALSGKHGVPTKTNPIVGRIAFWADDDTSKVNINTAAGFIAPADKDEEVSPKAAMDYAGSFWDTPRVLTDFDRGSLRSVLEESGRIDTPGLASCPPAQNEFQRYPGHPATTSLDVVFKHLLRKPAGRALPQFNSEKLYTWLPRMLPGGSRGGTVRLDMLFDRELPVKSATDILDYPGHPDLNGKTFHLYSSVDEMLYTPENTERRLAEDFLELPPNTITPELLDQSRFFLTAHSRAPELNLFGKPRVSVWPIWDESPNARLEHARNTPTDALLRFCSRVGGRDFIFTRKDPYSATADFNLPRNRALLEYLRRLTSRTEGRIPGFGGSFEEKLAGAPGGRDQLLAEIFDYIRTLNLKDSTRFKDIHASRQSNAQKEAEREKYMYAPRGLVVPTRAELGGNDVSGFGRFPTISEATIVFYHAGWVGRPKLKPTDPEQLIQDPDELSKFNVTHKLVRAFLLFETYNPMQGYAGIDNLKEKTEVLIHELSLPSDFTIRSENMGQASRLGFPSKAQNQIEAASGETWGGRSFGGTEGFFHTIVDKTEPIGDVAGPVVGKKWPKCKYAFRTQSTANGTGIEGVRVPVFDKRFSFSGGKAELAIKFNGQSVQKITLDFPPGSNWLLPRGLNASERDRLAAAGAPEFEAGELVAPAAHEDLGGFLKDIDLPAQNNPATKLPRPAVRREWAYSFERRLSWMISPKPGKEMRDHSYAPWVGTDADRKYYTNRWRNVLQPGDTVRSLLPGKADRPDLADPRVVALQRNVSGIFQPHPDYTSGLPRAQALRRADGEFYFRPEAPFAGSLVTLPKTVRGTAKKTPDLPIGMLAQRADGRAADFDTGIGNYPDGAFCGKADEGNVPYRWFDQSTMTWKYAEPYYDTGEAEEAFESYTHFSPNRQIPSPVMFGSLLARGSGWETLAFSPNPAGDEHPGLTSPRDHLLLDLFTMPVVEPYAISEPFSTAGKVNLNYQIMPFGYLKRTTALRAALQSVRVTAIPQNRYGDYKWSEDKPTLPNVRYLVDRDETLRAFEEFFAEAKTNPSKGFFKSATEICDRFLYPKGDTHMGKVAYRSKAEQPVKNFWANSALTGDNMREKPYADLYPRLTTKSNTYTVHYRVQTLRQRPYSGKGDEAAHYATWDEQRDSVQADLRGHTTIERYLDPEDKRFAANNKGERIDVEKESLEDAYRFRIIYNKRFAPW